MKKLILSSLKSDVHRKIALALVLAVIAAFTLSQVNLLEVRSQKIPDIEKTIPVADYNAEIARPETNFSGCGLQNSGEIEDNEALPLPTFVTRFPAPLFPVDSSRLIVVAEVLDVQAHLTMDRTYMYSKANLRIKEILKDDQHNMSLKTPFAAVRCLGGVQFESGRLAKYYSVGFGFPQKNKRYVLFIGDPARETYIHAGFELSDNGIVSIDTYGNTIPPDLPALDNYKSQSEKTFLANLRLLIRKSQGEPPGGHL